MHGRERTSCCDDTEIENPVINICVRCKLNDISIAACIAQDKLQRLPVPHLLAVFVLVSHAYLDRKSVLFGQLFSRSYIKSKASDSLLERFRGVANDGCINA